MSELKLNRVFNNLLRSDYKITDDTMLEKLLTHLGNDEEEGSRLLALPSCETWVQAVLAQWSEEKISCSVASFAIRLFGLIMKDETRFKFCISDQAEFSSLRRLATLMCSFADRADNFSIKCGYLKMIKSFAQHSTGQRWILQTRIWEKVLLWCRDKSMFVVREARAVMVLLLNSMGTDDNLRSEEIFCDILSPFLLSPTPDGNEHILNQQLHNNFLSALQVLYQILVGALDTVDAESCVVKSSVVRTLHSSKFGFEEKLLKLMQTCDEEIPLEVSSKALILFYIATFSSDIIKKTWPNDIVARFQTLCDDIFSLQEILVKKCNVRTVMKTCEVCLVQWHVVMSFVDRRGSTDPFHSTRGSFEVQQLCLQVSPLLVCWRTPQNSTHSLFITKLCNISCERFSRLINSYGGVVLKVSIPDSLPVSCVNGVMSILNSLTKENRVVLFRIFIYVLKCYTDSEVPVELREGNLPLTPEGLLGLVGTPKVPPSFSYISAILDCLSKVMTMFELTCRESSEASGLLSLALDVLTSRKLLRTVAVKVGALKLAKLCIENCFPPGPAMLTNVFPGTTVDQLGPTIMGLMNDPNWEVRDSTLELVLSIATVAKIKYPDFQDLIEEHQLCDMIVDFALNDSESYVCASAIKCLSTMTLIDRFWNDNLEKKNLPERMIDFVNGDGGDTVRTEATNFILCVYQYRTVEPDILCGVYTLMSKVIVSDFHWEVKVNAIRFWKAVIEKHLAEQGMIDGVFPEEIFSEEHRKMIQLTPETKQLRLTQSLEGLSKTGCLQVLFEALLEENDLHVLTEAAEVISFVANILRKHGLLSCNQSEGPATNIAPYQREFVGQRSVVADSLLDDTNKLSVEFSTSNVGLPHRNHSDESKNKNQDEIIDAILKDKDISLLANVYRGFGADPPMSEIDENFKKRMSDPMKPSAFLEKLKEIDVNAYVEGHRKWVEEASNDLESLLNDMLIHVRDDEEFNIADCY